MSTLSEQLTQALSESKKYLQKDGKTWGDYHDAGMWSKEDAKKIADSSSGTVEEDPSNKFVICKK